MIKLTGQEKQIFTLLLDVIKTRKLDLTLRVAGGWVRDKLLGIDCSDIDFALDKMMGQQFIMILSDYLKQHNIESHGLHVIKQNPNKSKHLETATILLFDHDLDFVNLRGEEYTEHSRIPIQTIGTPTEDAYRRDLTINALFYNINEDKIEDFTGKGLSDLKSGIIRTPLCPIQTFMDDPLRILRSFRFSARYNYSIEDEVFKATKSEEIKKSFIKKISKERIGKEFDANFKNIFDTKNPFLFFRHIYDSGYWEVILQNDLKEKIAMGYAMFQKLTDNYDQLKDLYIETADALKEIKSYEVIYLSHFAVLTIEFNDPSITDKKKQPIYDFIKNKVKRPNVCVDFTTRFQSSLVQLYQINKDFSVTSLALWQREAGYMWRLVATVFSIINDDKNAINVEKLITEHGLETFHKEKCLLNGKEVADYFNVSKEDIRKKLDEVIVWQAINRGATKKDLLKSFNLI